MGLCGGLLELPEAQRQMVARATRSREAAQQRAFSFSSIRYSRRAGLRPSNHPW